MAGRTVLVTGATSGIGLEAARKLAQMGARVVLGARNPARASAVALEITRRGGAAEVLPVDLASFESTREAAARFSASHERLDVLVNNAGTAVARREVTADGHERTWQTNFLGQFLLTRLLIPALRRAPKPRVVNVGSDAHRTGKLEWDNLELEKGYGGYRAYANTKLALALFTRELARREPGIAVNVLHPGAIGALVDRGAPALRRERGRSRRPSRGRLRSRGRDGPLLQPVPRSDAGSGGAGRRGRREALADRREGDGARRLS